MHFYKSLWVEFSPKKVCLFAVAHQLLGAESIYKVLDEMGLCAISQDVQRGDTSLGVRLEKSQSLKLSFYGPEILQS